MEESPTKSVKRDQSLDLLRGAAVIFMILTHVIVLFYRGEHPILQFFSWWGGTVCFTIFLFVFAAVLGLKLKKGKLDVHEELKRSIVFLLGYYLVIGWVHTFLVYQGSFHSIPKNEIGRLLNLSLQPEYTEFITTFIFYIWIFILLKPIWEKLIQHPWLTVLIGILLYQAGFYLYQFNPGDNYLSIIQGHLVGHDNVHTFGILPYAPVFTIGLVWGAQLTDPKFRKQLWAGVFTILFYLLFLVLKQNGVAPNRWPPTILFLLYGLVFSFVVMWLFPIIEWFKSVNQSISFVGQHAFVFYLLHLVILMPLQSVLPDHDPVGIDTLAIFTLTMGVISILLTVKTSVYRLDNSHAIG